MNICYNTKSCKTTGTASDNPEDIAEKPDYQSLVTDHIAVRGMVHPSAASRCIKRAVQKPLYTNHFAESKPPTPRTIIWRMNASLNSKAHVAQAVAPRKNPLSPKKLLLTKWTAVAPSAKEKHFLVTRVIKPEPPAIQVEFVEIEAVHSGCASRLKWRDLTDGNHWRQGWV